MATRRRVAIELAEQRFADTVRLDPTFALGYVARAQSRAVRSVFFESDTWLGVRPEFASEAERLETQQWLARAVAIDPNEGTSYTVRAWLADSATAAEKTDYRRQLGLPPMMRWVTSDSRSFSRPSTRARSSAPLKVKRPSR